MVNCLLNRVHQSGHLAELSPERFALVQEALALYKQIRQDIRRGVPFWPMGFADAEQDWLAGGLHCGNVIYLAVWRRGGEEEFEVELERAFPGEALQVACIYPQQHGAEYEYDPEFRSLYLRYEAPVSARLYRITKA